MNILAIETSCDETAVAILEVKEEKGNLNFKILANIVSSQIENHRPYGGVVPNLAATLHLENILPVIKNGLEKAKLDPLKIDFIAVTVGPGLIPALLVGVNTARTLSWLWQKPIIGVNHVEAHLLVNWLEIKSPRLCRKYGDKKQNIFPAVGLIVSGGHTQLIFLKDFGQYQSIGETRDDAAGEAFDKIARLLNFGYPGGPAIEKAARAFKNKKKAISLPQPMIKSDNFDFSFSGLKTAVSLLVKKRKLTQDKKNEFAWATQKAITDVLVSKTFKAVKSYQVKTLILSGGVAANSYLRKEFEKAAKSQTLKLIIPPINYCTDNAVMIAVAAYFKARKNKDFSCFVNSKIYGTWQKIFAQPNLEFVAKV